MNEIIQQIQFTGRVLHELRLVSSHGGNLSVRDGDYIYITKTGRMAGFLTEEDIIKLPLFKETQQDKEASIELIVHRKIYQKNPNISAIVHAHPITATTLAYFLEEFEPIDIEGQLFIKKVPICVVEKPSASLELAECLADIFSKGYVVSVVRSHGSFAVGRTLNEALKYTSTLENSAEIYYKWKTLNT
ncbi:class II aldolase/adducin family protein [Sulfurihydrogenibium sp.]|uniref:class II aldolase/adducin family protein n=1 Tax=Sulfurihydrogenibium sp. TaxID=2053621 RepID=UPI00260AED3C|nr:class II aldolase/adducin family protein [Sulfurihydrogenibium sp.]